MTPKPVETKELCIPKDEACTHLKYGGEAADYILDELKKLEADGISNPKLKAKATAFKKRLGAVKRKWDL